MSLMGKKIKINKNGLICGSVILLQLLWMQYRLLWASLGGTMYQLIYYMKYIASCGLLVYMLTLHRNIEDKRKLNSYLKILLPILIIMFGVELSATFGSPVVATYGISYWTRCIAGFLDKIFIVLMVACLWLLRGTQAINCVTSVLIFDGILLFIVDIIKNGIIDTMKTFLVVLGLAESTVATSALEVHELTYCLGLCIIYYLFFEKKDERKNKSRIIILIALFILGNKRIGFGGIIISGLFALFVHRKGLRKFNIWLIGITGTIICITYVALLYSGEVTSFLLNAGINMMGRDTIYTYFTNMTSFSPDFLGWGISAVSKSMENMSRVEVGNMVNVRGLHNDILKVYIECGFFGSIIWYWYNLIGIPIKLFNNFGEKDATLYIALAIFSFITYLTDNTENYFVFQVILFLIPLVAANKRDGSSIVS